jgi:alpha-mannosidase
MNRRDPDALVLKRAVAVQNRLDRERYRTVAPLRAEVTYDSEKTIPYGDLARATWRAIAVGEEWGELWGRGWFRFRGPSGDSAAAAPGFLRCALIDTGSEGCVYRQGTPWYGLTSSAQKRLFHRKRRVLLDASFLAGDGGVGILVDVSANQMFGEWNGRRFVLATAEIADLDIARDQLYHDFGFLVDLAKTVRSSASRYREVVAALRDACNAVDDGRLDDARGATQACIAEPGRPRRPIARSTGHAHLDLAWLWPVSETRRKAVRTSATALRMLEEYPDYVYSASQPQMYEWLEADAPEVFSQISARVAEGRWEPVGAMWVEPDVNVPEPESLIRQLLYGTRYWKERFGVDVTNAWLPDTFGFPRELPQLLSGAGITSFVTMKLAWNDRNPFPYHAFRWTGPDGSSVAAHILPAHEYHLDNRPSSIVGSEERFEAWPTVERYINLYGVGDGGGGPSRAHLENLARARDCAGLPLVESGPAGPVLNELVEAAADLPEWRGPLYLELHRGTFTAQAHTKRLHAVAEQRLRDLDLLVAAGLVARGSFLDEFWKELMLHEFHDILPGSSIGRVHREAEEALTRLGEQIERATVCSPDATYLNGLGWLRTVWIEDRWVTIHAHSARGVTTSERSTGTVHVSRRGGGLELANRHIAVLIADSGAISVTSQTERGRELVRDASLVMFPDHPIRWDAWDVASYYRDAAPIVPSVESLPLSRELPGGAIAVDVGLLVGSSRVGLTVTVRPDDWGIEVNLSVDWHETHKMLRFHVEHALTSDAVLSAAHYGFESRPAVANTALEHAAFEFCAHGWLGITTSDGSVGLAVQGKYGWSADGSVLDCNLLRSATDPDPNADSGHHHMRARIECRSDEMAPHDLDRALRSFLHPVARVGAPDGWTFPIAASGTHRADGCEIATIKPPADPATRGVVVRVRERYGSRDKCRISAVDGYRIVSVEHLSHVETPSVDTPVEITVGEDGREARLGLQPHQVVTIRVVYEEIPHV